MLSTLESLHSAIDDKNTGLTDMQLGLLAQRSASESVQGAVATLRDALQRERDEKYRAAVTRLHDKITHAGSLVKFATKPADLDGILRELDTTRDESNYTQSETIRAELAALRNARQFVISWQDYLSSRNSGNLSEARDKLSALSHGNAESADFIPRSEILALIEEMRSGKDRPVVEESNEIVGRIKSLDDLAAAVPALLSRQTYNASNDPARERMNRLINEFQFIYRTYAEYKAGLPVRIDEFSVVHADTSITMPQITYDLRAQMLRLLYERQLNLGPKWKPGTDEPIPDYLGRLMADARERCDARLISRIRELQERTGASQDYESTRALQDLISAQNQQDAGQFIPAVLSYQSALKNGNSVVPAEAVGKRLDAIKAAHPEEYDKAMAIFLGTGKKPEQRREESARAE